VFDPFVAGPVFSEAYLPAVCVFFACCLYDLTTIDGPCSGEKVSTSEVQPQKGETDGRALSVYLRQQALLLPSSSLEVRRALQQ
jgi:hypothetical protein